MGHWFVKNAAVNPLYQRSDVYPQHVHHVLSSVDFITPIKTREQQGVLLEVQCTRLFVNKYKTKKKMDHLRVNSFASAQSQLSKQ